MEKNKLILLTGAAGFIGSYLLGYLNRNGYANIILVDDFSKTGKNPNYERKEFAGKIERDDLFNWLATTRPSIDFVFHIGARTDTTEFDYSIHERLNVEYSKKIWQFCAANRVPLVYASSAATYGGGELGYKDDHELTEQLNPLNPYGRSKNEFDKWALQQAQSGHPDAAPPFWAGLKFFNVYGPNEYHKGRMASVIFHSFKQIQSTGMVKLFRSHKPGFRDGEQLRDFIYVGDVAAVCFWLMNHPVTPGLYNLGTGRARTFNDLVSAIFSSLDLKPHIEYIDTPPDIRDRYQYFTEADMNKLKAAGYPGSFYTLEEGIGQYVKNFLTGKEYY